MNVAQPLINHGGLLHRHCILSAEFNFFFYFGIELVLVNNDNNFNRSEGKT